MDGEIAARKGYKRADLRSFPRRMWRPLRERGDAGRHRRARPEILGVQAIVGDPPACKAVDETAHKRGWTADVEVRIGRDAHFLEHLHAHAPHPVKIDRGPIGWLWRTVTNVAAACGQGLANVNPIFTWVRLAQRIPVRVHIDQVPEGVVLSAGMTATVQIDPRPAMLERE